MDAKETQEFAKLIEQGVIRTYGKDWRRMLTLELQKGLVAAEVLKVVLSWRGASATESTGADVQAITRAAYDRLFPSEG